MKNKPSQELLERFAKFAFLASGGMEDALWDACDDGENDCKLAFTEEEIEQLIDFASE